VGCGPEWSRAGGLAIINRHIVDDMADPVDTSGIEVGSLCITGARVSSRGGLGCVGRLLDRR
jgi:hypothetical protein